MRENPRLRLPERRASTWRPIPGRTALEDGVRAKEEEDRVLRKVTPLSSGSVSPIRSSLLPFAACKTLVVLQVSVCSLNITPSSSSS